MLEILKNTISITVFVSVMMMVIEYFNIRTKGKWHNKLEKNKFLQILIAVFLGAIPGCLGAYTVVSLYTHGVFSFGAVVATMIATFGDEAFIMLAMMPKETMIISIVLILVAILTGLIVNIFYKKKYKDNSKHLHIHEEEQCICFQSKIILENLKKISFVRAVLLFSILIFMGFLFFSGTGHNHSDLPFSSTEKIEKVTHHESESTIDLADNHDEEHHISWVKLTFILISLIAFFIVITVPEHFLEEHLWNHIIKKHFIKVFLWTFGILSLVYLMNFFVDINDLVKNNLHIILILAVLIGILPESGPHLIFVSLFLSGTIPLSILMANSIVQDGHGALPLFAEDKRGFFLMKFINVNSGYRLDIVSGVVMD
jgi:hypothetical protein